MNYLLYLIFGVIPSLTWLGYFLRKDIHPEPKGMVLKIFLYGMLAALVAVFIEIGIFEELVKIKLPRILISILIFFLGIALVEEVLKYLVVKEKVLSNPELDEPIDIPLYMIISALGFAAFENILFFLSPGYSSLGETLILVSFRFISATFLHALCSGLVGIFLALAFFETKERFRLIFSGLILATVLHGLYNFSIMVEGKLKFIIPVAILISLSLILSLTFKKLKNFASICKIS